MLAVPQETRQPQGKGKKKTVTFLAVAKEGTLNIIKGMPMRTYASLKLKPTEH